MNKCIFINPINANFYSKMSELLYNLGDFSECIEKSTESLLLGGESFDEYVRLAISYLNTKKYSESIFFFKEAKKYDITESEKAYLLANMALALYNINEYDAALDNLNSAIELDSNYYFAYLRKGYIYEMKKDYEESLTFFLKALSKAKPSSNRLGEINFKICETYCSLSLANRVSSEYGKKYIQIAYKYCEQSVKYEPENERFKEFKKLLYEEVKIY